VSVGSNGFSRDPVRIPHHPEVRIPHYPDTRLTFFFSFKVNQQGRLDLHPVFEKYADGSGGPPYGGEHGAAARTGDAQAGGIAGALGGGRV